jgi:hypothetical protein
VRFHFEWILHVDPVRGILSQSASALLDPERGGRAAAVIPVSFVEAIPSVGAIV